MSPGPVAVVVAVTVGRGERERGVDHFQLAPSMAGVGLPLEVLVRLKLLEECYPVSLKLLGVAVAEVDKDFPHTTVVFREGIADTVHHHCSGDWQLRQRPLAFVDVDTAVVGIVATAVAAAVG